MLFKTTDLSAEFFRIHPELRRALFELDAKIEGWDFPPLTLVHLHRTVEQQEQLYWGTFSGVDEAAARAKARRKFSWHLADCGADLRSRDYSEEQANQIRAWIAERCPSPMWEFLPEEHAGSTGPHFHLARQDFLWRQRYERDTNTSTGAV